jgi:ferritin-like metal-binding protein YciE
MSDNETREVLATGLKNAHAMENQALSIMKPQLSRIENYPVVAAKLGQHIRETKGPIVRIEGVLDGLYEDHSSLKDIALSFTGAMAAMGHTTAGDEILKNSFENFAFENFEIAADAGETRQVIDIMTNLPAASNGRDLSGWEKRTPNTSRTNSMPARLKAAKALL